MLAEQGIISRDDNNAIQQGLETIRGEITAGKMAFTPDLEDIHMHIEVRLKQLIGDAAGRRTRTNHQSRIASRCRATMPSANVRSSR